MEALESRILACHPSQTGREDYEGSTVKVLLVDKRPNYLPNYVSPESHWHALWEQ